MNQIFRVFAGVAALLVLLFLGGFWLLFFSERPPLEIDPETLAGDGSTVVVEDVDFKECVATVGSIRILSFDCI